MTLVNEMRILTFYNLVVGKVKVEQEEHMEDRQSPAEKETRSLTHCPGQQSGYLTGEKTKVSAQLRDSRPTGDIVLTMRRVDNPPQSSQRT